MSHHRNRPSESMNGPGEAVRPMGKRPAPASAKGRPREEPSSLHAPSNCRWAYVAGTVRTTPTVNAAGVLWTCRLRDQGTTPLFLREECEACGRWSVREGPARSEWPDGAEEPSQSSASPVTRVRYRRGAAIIQEGARADVLYTILSGTAKLYKMTSSSRAIGIDICAPGSPLGAEWMLQESLFPATAVALEDTTCVAVSRRVVLTLLNEHPALVRELVSQAGEHLSNLMSRMAQLAGARVEARFAHLFLALADKIGVREDGRIAIRIPLLRQDLADLTGTTVETTIRLMSRWDREGILTTQVGGFVIRHRKTLERFRRS